MSRCFPFPPPGYEKKDRHVDTVLLAKDKHKEKRHKKDKKDKNKREGKEKKDEERNREKLRDKKDRKEKHKDKDKDRDKEKRTSDEKKIVGPPECHNGGKLHPNCPRSDETKDSKFLLELGKRIRDDSGAQENQMVQGISTTNQRRAEFPVKVVGNNICNLAEGKDNYKQKREDDRKANGQKNRVEARSIENLIVQDFSGLDQKRVGVARTAANDLEKQMDRKEKNKKKDSDSRGDGHKDRDQEKKVKSKDKDRDKKKEKKEKTKEKEPNKVQAKLKESNKDILDNHNAETSYLLKESNENSASNGSLGKRKEHEGNGLLDNEIRPMKLPRSVSSSHLVIENGRKLEPFQALHFASERPGEANNHKVDNKISFSHPIMKNGRKLEQDQGAIHSATEKQRAGNNHRKDNKNEPGFHGLIEAQQQNVCSIKPSSTPVQAKVEVESSVKPRINGLIEAQRSIACLIKPSSAPVQAKVKVESSVKPKINGLIEAQPPNVCSIKPPSAPVQAKVKAESSVKSPHPDCKYLSQILSVPKVEWPDFDEQEWLFRRENLQAKPTMLSFEVDGTRKVWAEALQIESADITALPYVIPY